MSAEGDKAAVFRTTKVRNKLKGDFSWLQRREEPEPETTEEKPWMAEVKACRQNGAVTETSPVSSPTKTTPYPTKNEPERASAPGFMIRGIFTKLDKPASTATTNSASGGTQFAKKPSDSYKKIAPHTVRSTSENQEGQLSKEEQDKRTEAASNILKKSAARQRSYVLSAAKKFESQQEESETPEVKSPPFVAKRVEITDDDESTKTAAPASTPPTSAVRPVTSVASAPQPKPRKIVDTKIKTAGDVAVNEPVAPEQEEEVEKKEEAAPEPVKQDSPAASATEADPFEQMTPGCTKVFTPLPELNPETVQAVCAEVEPEDSESPKQLVPPLLKVTPATPVSVSPTPESEVPDSPVPDSSVPGSTAEEFVTPESQAPAPSVPESPAPEPVTPESPASSVPQSSALESITPESQAPDSSAPESPALVSITPESPTPASPVSESSTLVTITSESQVPESTAPTSPVSESSALVTITSESQVPESTAPTSPVSESSTLVTITSESQVPESTAPTSPVSESFTLVTITSESQVPESTAPTSPVSESYVLVSDTPQSPGSSAVESPAPDLLIPESSASVPCNIESTTSVVLESPAPVSPAPDSPVLESPAIVSQAPEPPAVPVTDLLLPESVTTVSSDPESNVPVPPALVSAVTEVIVNTEPEPEPSSNISSSTDTLTALSDTLISFDTSSTSLKSDEPVLAGEEGSSVDVRATDYLAELEPVPQLSNCVPVTDDLLARSNGPEASAEPVPPSPGRWSQDLLSNTNGESNQVKVGGALDLLADDVIVINTEARSLSMQREEEIPAAGETQSPPVSSPTETVTITTKTVIITDKGEQRTVDPWSSHVTTTVNESSSADPFDPHPIGTTSPNRPFDLLQPLSDVSINSYSTQNKDPSPETNMSSDALGSLADDIIPIDTGTASLSTQRSWARTWDTSTPQQANAGKSPPSQGAEGGGQDGDPNMVIMFERKSKENDSPWDRWTSPTIYTVTTEEEEEEEKEESPEDTQQTQTVTTITTIREIQSEPVPAMDRYTTYSRTVIEEDQRVPTPEPEAKKGFVYVKEYVNATELALHNARDIIPSGSDLTSSLTTYSYSSPSTYCSGSLSSVCTYCGELVGNDARISIEDLNINSHPDCFKCDGCFKVMGDLLDNMFIHRGKVNCDTCYAKAFD